MFGLGSQSQLGIGIAVRLHDQFSNQARNVNNQLLAMRKNANSALMGAMKDYRNNSLMIATGAAGVSLGIFGMVKAASEYDHVINQISIIGGKQLGKTRKELSAFAQELSSTFPTTPFEIADIMAENVRQGVTGSLEEITRYQVAVGIATKEAVAGEQGVARGLLGIMGSMDLAMSEFPRVANAVTAVANSSMSSVFSINEAMQYFANTAKMAGLNVEQTLAMVGRLSQANIPGSSMGTALMNMIRHATMSVGSFQSPKNKKAWAMLGISSDEVVNLINQGRWFDLIGMVDQATRGMARQPKQMLLGQVFGIRGVRGLLNLFGNANPEQTLQAYYQKALAGGRTDIAMKQGKAMANDTWSDIIKIGTAIARFGIQLLNAGRPVIRVLLGIVTKVVDVFGYILSTPIGNVLAGIAVVGAPLIAILFAFRAAALTATIALRGFAMASSVGGFGGLLRGGLGAAGMARFGPMGGAFTRTVAGRMTVAPGQTVNFGGKVYKGGQLLPQAFASSMGISSVFQKAGTGFFSKAGPMLGRMLGFGLKWLPVIGGIWMGIDLLKGIFGNTNKQRKEVDPLIMQYYKNLDQQLLGMSAPGASFYDQAGISYAEFLKQYDEKAAAKLNQTININLDGQNSQQLLLQQTLEKNLNNTMDFEMPD